MVGQDKEVNKSKVELYKEKGFGRQLREVGGALNAIKAKAKKPRIPKAHR